MNTRPLTFSAEDSFNVTVRRWLFAIVALLLTLAVCYICVCPSVDLDPTINRAWQLAALLLSALAFLATVVIDSVPPGFSLLVCEWLPGRAASPPARSLSAVALSCSRLC